MPRDGRSAPTVLVVDDLQGVRQLLRSVLEKAGYEVLEAEDGRRGLDLVRTESPDVLLLDIRMPGLDGFAVLERARAADPELPVIMVTAYADTDTAVSAMQLGAYDYLSKPFNHGEVLAVVERALEHRRLAREVRTLHDQFSRVGPLAEQLGTSDAIGDLLEATGRVAQTDQPVLIAAEPGSGSELVARAIHARSARRNGPFVAVDCGAVPAEQIAAKPEDPEPTMKIKTEDGDVEVTTTRAAVLTEVLGRDADAPARDVSVRIAAVRGLGSIGGEQAAEALQQSQKAHAAVRDALHEFILMRKFGAMVPANATNDNEKTALRQRLQGIAEDLKREQERVLFYIRQGLGEGD